MLAIYEIVKNPSRCARDVVQMKTFIMERRTDVQGRF